MNIMSILLSIFASSGFAAEKMEGENVPQAYVYQDLVGLRLKIEAQRLKMKPLFYRLNYLNQVAALQSNPLSPEVVQVAEVDLLEVLEALKEKVDAINADHDNQLLHKPKEVHGDIHDSRAAALYDVFCKVAEPSLGYEMITQWIGVQPEYTIKAYGEVMCNHRRLKWQRELATRNNGELYFAVDYPNIYEGLLQRSQSDGTKNDCLLFSIMRNDRDLLTKIVGLDQANAILSRDEFNGRDLSAVRAKICDDILVNLETKYPLVEGTKSGKTEDTFADILLAMIWEHKQDLGLNGPDSASDIQFVFDYLSHLVQSKCSLEKQMATIISLLYNVQAYVYQPSTANGKELILTTPSDYRLQGQKIIVYHDGQGGGHYQKLLPYS